MEDKDIMTQMQEQMAVLREKLEDQTIVNDRILRKSCRTSLGKLRMKNNSTIFLGIVAMLLSVSFYMIGLSIYFFIATELMMIVAVVSTVLMNRYLPDPGKDVMSATEDLTKFRKGYMDWLKISIPMICIWLAWLGYEIWRNYDMPDKLKIGFAVGCLVGGIVGLILGLIMHRNIVRSTDELISDIKELKDTI